MAFPIPLCAYMMHAFSSPPLHCAVLSCAVLCRDGGQPRERVPGQEGVQQSQGGWVPAGRSTRSGCQLGAADRTHWSACLQQALAAGACSRCLQQLQGGRQLGVAGRTHRPACLQQVPAAAIAGACGRCRGPCAGGHPSSAHKPADCCAPCLLSFTNLSTQRARLCTPASPSVHTCKGPTKFAHLHPACACV